MVVGDRARQVIRQQYAALEDAACARSIIAIYNINHALGQALVETDPDQVITEHYKQLSLYAKQKLKKQQLEVLNTTLPWYTRAQEFIRLVETEYSGYRVARPTHFPTQSLYLFQLRRLYQVCAKGLEGAYAEGRGAARAKGEHEEEVRTRGKIRGSPSYERWEEARRAAEEHMDYLPIIPTLNPPDAHEGFWQGAQQTQVNYGLTEIVIQVKSDQFNNLVSRRVIKTAMIEDEHWGITSYRRQGGKIVPLEWYTQTIVGAAPETRFSLRTMDEAKVDERRQEYTTYMPYCPHGTLKKLWQNHLGTEELIPEDFLWLVFQALVETGMVMKQGGVTASVPGWQEIVHRDMKPDNVFLDLPKADHFPQYPRPLLADYGYAFLTSEDDVSNPTLWVGAGTAGYFPPEQLIFVDGNTDEPIDAFKILSPCNVWGISAIMASLINHSDPRQPKYNDGTGVYPDGTDHEYQLQDVHFEIYPNSLDLCKKVNECLQFDPIMRPKIEDLLEWVNDRIQATDGLRRANVGDQPAPGGPLYYEPDPYTEAFGQ